jgi:hypothetical protein
LKLWWFTLFEIAVRIEDSKSTCISILWGPEKSQAIAKDKLKQRQSND